MRWPSRSPLRDSHLEMHGLTDNSERSFVLAGFSAVRHFATSVNRNTINLLIDPDHRTRRYKRKSFANATGATRCPHHLRRLECSDGLCRTTPPRKICLCSGLPPGPGRAVTPSHSETPGALAHLALSQIPTKGYRSVFHGWVSIRFLCGQGGPWRTFT